MRRIPGSKLPGYDHSVPPGQDHAVSRMSPLYLGDLSFCHLLFVMLNELQAGSAFDRSGSQSRDQAPLYDGEKYDSRHNRDDGAGGDQSPLYLQALQKAL